MFLRAIRHEKPTNVALGNPSCDYTPCGTIAHTHHLKMPLKMPLPDELGSGDGDGDRMKNLIF